jgi:hypothetical protein
MAAKKADGKAGANAEDHVDDPALLRFQKMAKPLRVVYARPRTFVAIAVGIVAFFLLPTTLRPVTRISCWCTP